MDVEVETSGSAVPNDPLPRYVYKPLQSDLNIRLIHLKPATDPEAEIVLYLSEHHITRAPRYEALSYTWGDASDVRDITIITPITTSGSLPGSDSQDHDAKQVAELEVSSQKNLSPTTLSVTYNCYSALRRLRNSTTPRRIWIDAICINQDDVQERNSQISLMYLIYQLCIRLVMDVGDASPTSNAAIDFIVQYHQHRDAGELDEDGVYDIATGLHIRDIICEFYARPWFSRVWVLQEVFLGAGKFRWESTRLPALLNCGGRSVQWSNFKPLHINVDSSPAGETENWHIGLPSITLLPLVLRIVPFGSEDDKPSPRHDERFRFLGNGNGEDTLNLLCLARSNEATDPRDKVFALLSLRVRLSAHPMMEADYGKPVTEVYINAAVWLLREGGLHFLSCCGTMQENDHGRPEGLPSWVPDWNERYSKQWMIGGSNIYTPLRAGGDPSKGNSRWLTLPTTVATTILDADIHGSGRAQLKVRGVSVDKIEFVSGQINIRDAADNECKHFVEMCRLYREGLNRGFEDAAEGHIRPTGAACLPMPQPWKPKTGERRLHPPNWAAYEYGLPLKNPDTLTDNELCDYISFFTANRQLAMTNRGYFGVVPRKSSVGDNICCFLSAGVPFVMREGDNGTYTLIGESYIYGLMEGEAFGDADKANGMTETQDTVPIDPLQDFLIS